MNQKAFAESLNVGQGAVSKWETGETAPGPHTYLLLAEMANGNLRELLLKDGNIKVRRAEVSVPVSFEMGEQVDHDRMGNEPIEPDIQAINGSANAQGTANENAERGLLWEPDLLVFVIETVSEELRKRGRKLPPDKFAQMVVLFYEFCQVSKSHDTGMVERLLKIA
jgi:transcriptional regulator with XRE-family HTH domain